MRWSSGSPHARQPLVDPSRGQEGSPLVGARTAETHCPKLIPVSDRNTRVMVRGLTPRSLAQSDSVRMSLGSSPIASTMGCRSGESGTSTSNSFGDGASTSITICSVSEREGAPSDSSASRSRRFPQQRSDLDRHRHVGQRRNRCDVELSGAIPGAGRRDRRVQDAGGHPQTYGRRNGPRARSHRGARRSPLVPQQFVSRVRVRIPPGLAGDKFVHARNDKGHLDRPGRVDRERPTVDGLQRVLLGSRGCSAESIGRGDRLSVPTIARITARNRRGDLTHIQELRMHHNKKKVTDLKSVTFFLVRPKGFEPLTS